MSYDAWKQVGKAMAGTYALMGLAWWWDETAPLGWWTLKPRTKVCLLFSYRILCSQIEITC
jgi:hypothetical protein